MLHRCAFDARSSVALSAHPWNLLYHSRVPLESRADFSRRAIFLQFSFPSRRVSLSRVGVRIFLSRSASTEQLSRKPITKPNTQHHPLHFPCNIFFSTTFFAVSESRRRKIFRCAAFGMEWKKVVFSLFRERRKIYSKIREQQQSPKKYFKVNENIAADVTAIDGNRKETRLALQMTSRF